MLKWLFSYTYTYLISISRAILSVRNKISGNILLPTQRRSYLLHVSQPQTSQVRHRSLLIYGKKPLCEQKQIYIPHLAIRSLMYTPNKGWLLYKICNANNSVLYFSILIFVITYFSLQICITDNHIWKPYCCKKNEYL